MSPEGLPHTKSMAYLTHIPLYLKRIKHSATPPSFSGQNLPELRRHAKVLLHLASLLLLSVFVSSCLLETFR